MQGKEQIDVATYGAPSSDERKLPSPPTKIEVSPQSFPPTGSKTLAREYSGKKAEQHQVDPDQVRLVDICAGGQRTCLGLY